MRLNNLSWDKGKRQDEKFMKFIKKGAENYINTLLSLDLLKYVDHSKQKKIADWIKRNYNEDGQFTEFVFERRTFGEKYFDEEPLKNIGDIWLETFGNNSATIIITFQFEGHNTLDKITDIHIISNNADLNKIQPDVFWYNHHIKYINIEIKYNDIVESELFEYSIGNNPDKIAQLFNSILKKLNDNRRWLPYIWAYILIEPSKMSQVYRNNLVNQNSNYYLAFF